MNTSLVAVSLERVAGLLRGVTEVEALAGGIAPLRLPAWTRIQQADDWCGLWAAHTLGVRLVTMTAATKIRLSVTVTRMAPAPGEQPIYISGFLATVGGEAVDEVVVTEGPRVVTLPDGSRYDEPGPATVVELNLGRCDGAREVTVWFPHSAAVVVHGVHADAELLDASPNTKGRWLHHGSSISHSLEATTPLGTWPQLAASKLDLELTNLAVAGNAQLDPFMARTLASIPADIITLKLGVNVVNRDAMRERAFTPALHGFLDLLREGHPGVPIVVITSIVAPSIENVPGPTTKDASGQFQGTPRIMTTGDGTLTVARTRDLVARAVKKRQQIDPDLYLGDGLQLFADADRALLRDGLHPTAEGYAVMASRFASLARDSSTGIGTAFARVLR